MTSTCTAFSDCEQSTIDILVASSGCAFASRQLSEIVEFCPAELLIGSHFVPMSSSMADHDVEHVLREMLRKARDDGCFEQLMHRLIEGYPDSEFELIPTHGAMSDASKRRMVDPPEKDDDDEAQRPIKPTTPAGMGLKLPQGMASVDDWGRTVLCSGKYGKDGMSYEEIFMSKKAEHKSYCSWMLNQSGRADLTAPVKDFVRYLCYQSSVEDGSMCFEGSTVKRQMKPKGA